MRILKGLLALGFFFVSTAVVVAALGLYLAVSGASLPLLRALAGRLGQVIAGQHVEQLDLKLRVRPSVPELDGVARLETRAEAAGRQHLYFLLNDGLRVHRVWAEQRDGTEVALPFVQLWLLTIVDLPRPLAADEAIRIGMAYRGDPRASGLAAAWGVVEPDEVVLNADNFWYPSDVQGFFNADVELTAPAELNVVHNGREISRARRGRSERVRWTSLRAVPGLALVAGRYREWSREDDSHRYRVLLPPDVDLDGERLASSVAASERFFDESYGPSGLPQLTVFVSRRLGRAFHDGGGLIGVGAHYFRGGDYGTAILAHEVAHGWWGGTVGAKWLQPDSGSEWMVEGFAELSSWLAVRAQLGEAAFLRRLSERFYDPTRAGVLGAMSVLDNAFDPSARMTIYNKGAYVALMLRQQLGEEAFFAGAREFLDRYRYHLAGERDLEAVFEETSQQDVSAFFEQWVRSDAGLDLSLDPQDGGAVARRVGAAPATGQIDLWRFPGEDEPERQTIAIGASTPLGNVERLVLDPLALIADMYRSNNVFPRRDNPRAVARSARGDFMLVYGEPAAWAPASVAHMDARGRTLHSWPFDRGVSPEPAWSADGTRMLAVEPSAGGPPKLSALNTNDGSRQTLGYDTTATGFADGVAVARNSRLVRRTGGREAVLVNHPGGQVGAPLASPDGKTIAYTLAVGSEMDLRVVGADGGGDRLLLTVPVTDLAWQWSRDGARLFAVVGGDWDWQLWELPLERTAPRSLVREAASMTGLAVAPDGRRIAIIAAAALDYGRERREVFVIERTSGEVQRFNLGGKNAHSLAWLDEGSLLVIVSDPTFPVVPPQRELRRLVLADGSLAPFP